MLTVFIILQHLYKTNYLGGTGFMASKLCDCNALHPRIEKFPEILMVIFKKTGTRGDQMVNTKHTKVNS